MQKYQLNDNRITLYTNYNTNIINYNLEDINSNDVPSLEKKEEEEEEKKYKNMKEFLKEN